MKHITLRLILDACDFSTQAAPLMLVRSQGMNVQEASLPGSRHKLHMSVEDSMGSKGYWLG